MGTHYTGLMDELRYPIGQSQIPATTTPEQCAQWIRDIASLPENLRDAVENLTPDQLATPYRPGGWTVAQLVHHVADSHMNCYIRFKLALTEDHPTIKPYNEADWANLPDSGTTPIAGSLALLDALHVRWTNLLRSLSEAQLRRQFYHPENKADCRLDQALYLYAWHGRHHTAHVTRLRERMGWS